MVAGHISEKKGYYYAVLNYKDYTGKRKSKWVSTGLPIKGNKRRAEKILADIKRDFVPEEPKRIRRICRNRNRSLDNIQPAFHVIRK